MTEFKTGVRVLIPGTILEVGSGTVIVATAFGNTIVERSSDLQLASSKSDKPVDKPVEQRVERVARVMCEADAIDPESQASIGQPLMLPTGYVVTGTPFEAWRLYAKYARAVIDGGLA